MPGSHWTEEQLAKLRQLIANGADPRDTDFSIKGRTQRAIVNKAFRLSLIDIRREGREEWPLFQRRRLAKAKREGLTPEQVLEEGLLGEPFRSLWAIKKKWGRMKLTDKRRRHGGSRKRIWKQGEREKFHAFLREFSDSIHPDLIAKEWNVKTSTVRQNQLLLGVAPGRDAVMEMEYSKTKRSRSARREMIRRWREKHTLRIEELEQRAQELFERKPNRRKRDCIDCCRTWPLTKEFFPFSTKRYAGTTMTTVNYQRSCRLCYSHKSRT